MDVLYQIHRVFGEMILPLLIVIAAIYLTVTYKGGAPSGPVARIFPILVDLQVTLGLVLWILRLVTIPGGASYYLGFPFILHPIIGFVAAGLAHMAVGAKNPLHSLGRWAPMASLGALLVLVISNVLLATQS